MSFTSRRERWAWVLAGVAVVATWAGIALAGAFEGQVTPARLVEHTFFNVFVALAVATVVAIVFAGSRAARLAAVVIVTSVAVMTVLRALGPAERTHLVEYAAVALLIEMALRERRRHRAVPERPTVVAGLIASGIGVADELVQAVVPSRVFDPVDVGFNVGAVVGVLTAAVVVRRVLGEPDA